MKYDTRGKPRAFLINANMQFLRFIWGQSKYANFVVLPSGKDLCYNKAIKNNQFFYESQVN
jgi:hypothetical protein